MQHYNSYLFKQLNKQHGALFIKTNKALTQWFSAGGLSLYP